MNRRQTHQYAMLVRVRDFGTEHKDRFLDGSEGGNAFAAVTAAVADVDAFTKARLTARRVSSTGKRAANRALRAWIGAIARSARVVAKKRPGADEKFPPLTGRSDFAVLQTGRLFVQEAAHAKEMFIRCGLAPTFLEDLQRAVKALEDAISERSGGRVTATVSQQGIRASVSSGVDAVQSLDTLVANVLGGDEMAMYTWKRVRHVDVDIKSGSVEARTDALASQPSVPIQTVTLQKAS